MTEAFETFGGVPKVIVTDNMKTVMDEARTEHFSGTINNKFAQFAQDFGFKVQPVLQDVQIQRKNRSTNEAFR